MDDLKKLYEAVSSKFDVGSFDEFSAKMQTPEDRKSFYDVINSKGFDLGNYDEYETRLSGSPKGANAEGNGESGSPSADTTSSSELDVPTVEQTQFQTPDSEFFNNVKSQLGKYKTVRDGAGKVMGYDPDKQTPVYDPQTGRFAIENNPSEKVGQIILDKVKENSNTPEDILKTVQKMSGEAEIPAFKKIYDYINENREDFKNKTAEQVLSEMNVDFGEGGQAVDEDVQRIINEAPYFKYENAELGKKMSDRDWFTGAEGRLPTDSESLSQMYGDMATYGFNIEDFNGYLESNNPYVKRISEEGLADREVNPEKVEYQMFKSLSNYVKDRAGYLDDYKKILEYRLMQGEEVGEEMARADYERNSLTKNLFTYAQENLPNFQKLVDQRQNKTLKEYEAYKNKENGLIGEFSEGVVQGAFNAIDDAIITVADGLGFDNFAEQARIGKEISDMYESNPMLQLHGEGKRVTYKGNDYLITDDDRIIDLETKKNVTSIADELGLDIEKLKQKEGDRDWFFSPYNATSASGEVMGNLAVQIVATRGLGGIVGNTSKAMIASNMAVTGGIIYTSTYEDMLNQLREAGLPEADVINYSNEIALTTGFVGMVTSSFAYNPEALKLLGGGKNLLTKAIVQKALQAEATGGKKAMIKVVRDATVKALAKGGKEGLEEAIQENLEYIGQQLATQEVNKQIGENVLQGEIKLEDIINNTVLAFTASAPLAAAGSLSENTPDKLQLYSKLASNFNSTSETVNKMIKDGVIDKAKGEKLLTDVENFMKYGNKLPKDLEAEKVFPMIEAVSERNELENRKKTEDKAFHKGINEQIEKVDEKINEIMTTKVEKKKPAEKTPENAKKLPTTSNYINVGLNVGKTNETISEEDVVSALPSDVKVLNSDVFDFESEGNTEKTMSLELSRKLTSEEMDTLLEKTKQLAIPQLSEGKGEMFGSKDWGEFNPDYFSIPENKPTEVEMTNETVEKPFTEVVAEKYSMTTEQAQQAVDLINEAKAREKAYNDAVTFDERGLRITNRNETKGKLGQSTKAFNKAHTFMKEAGLSSQQEINLYNEVAKNNEQNTQGQADTTASQKTGETNQQTGTDRSTDGNVQSTAQEGKQITKYLPSPDGEGRFYNPDSTVNAEEDSIYAVTEDGELVLNDNISDKTLKTILNAPELHLKRAANVEGSRGENNIDNYTIKLLKPGKVSIQGDNIIVTQKPTIKIVEKSKVQNIKTKTQKLASNIRSYKINASVKDSMSKLSSSGLFEAAWDISLEAAATTIELTGDAAQAIIAAVDTLRMTDWYKQLSREGRIKAERMMKEDLEREFNNGEKLDQTYMESIKASWTKVKEVVLQKMVDRFYKLRKALKKEFTIYGDSVNFSQAEITMHGKAANDLDEFHKNEVVPFVKNINKLGYTFEQVSDYLYAKHAEERNKHIKENIDPENEFGSGMTPQTANKILNETYTEEQKAELEELSKQAYKMIQKTRDTMLKHGLITQEQYDAYMDYYKNYVPLQGFESESIEGALTIIGVDLSVSRNLHRSSGRSTKAANVIANIIQQRSVAVLDGRKNEALQTLYKLGKENPNNKMFQIFEKGNLPKRMITRSDGTQANTPENPFARKDYVAVKVEGEQYYLKFANEHLGRILQGADIEKANIVSKYARVLNRYLSATLTTLDPEFVVSNFTRDIQTAVINVLSESDINENLDGANIAKSVVRDTFKAIGAIYGSEVKGKNNSEFQKYYQEFKEDGAKTGWANQYNVNDIIKSLKNIQKDNTTKKVSLTNVKKQANNVLEFVGNVNTAVENGVRLSAYINGRKAGMTRQQAAAMAKELTVNFNQRGEWGAIANSFYLFFNASVQGTARFIYAMKTFKKTLRDDGSIKYGLNRGQKMALGIMVFAGVIAAFNRELSAEDEDGELFYDKIPDFEKERNFIFMNPFNGEDYFKIPLPYGYNFFHNVGTAVAETSMGSRSVGDALGFLTSSAISAFSPISLSSSDDTVNSITKTGAPTVIKPFVDLAVNEDFFGREIYREDLPFGLPKPDSDKGKPSTPETFKHIAKWMNEVSGGTDFEPGKVDVTPEALYYLTKFYIGGTGRFLTNTAETAGTAIDKSKGIETDYNLRKVPFIRKVYAEPNEYVNQSIFFDRSNMLQQREKSIEQRRQKGEMTDKDRATYNKVRSMVNEYKDTAKELKKIREEKKAVEQQIFDPVRRSQRLKKLDERYYKLIKRTNKRFNQKLGANYE